MGEPEFSDDLFPEGALETLQDVAITLMRVGTAAMMIHHGQEKLLSAEMFTNFVMTKYFAFLPGPAIAWTYAAGAVQAAAPIFLALGVASRPAAASLAGTTLAAMYYHLISTGTEGFPLSTMAEKVPVFHNYAFEGPFVRGHLPLLRHHGARQVRRLHRPRLGQGQEPRRPPQAVDAPLMPSWL